MTWLAVAFAVAGLAVLVALAVVQAFPSPWWLWLALTAAFVGLDFSSVEISGRMLISSSIMVGFTAAVIFGRESAVLAVALMAAAAVAHPQDIRLRRWRQPAANFGQLVLSATAGMTVFLQFLPPGDLVVSDLPRVALGAALAAVVHNWVNFRLVSLFVRSAYGRSVGAWSEMLPTHMTLTVLGAFGAVLGAAFVLVGPVILPLMMVTFLVGHVGFISYSNLRRAHEDTIRGFVKVVEALDPYTRGHTERVAHLCDMTAAQLGLDHDRRELLRWSALIHDVGKVAAPPELLHRPGPLDEDEQRQLVRHMRVVEGALARASFLAPMVAIVAAHEAAIEGNDTELPLEAQILAVADMFDLMTSTRSYRTAVTQTEAFAVIRQRKDRLGPRVVAAFIAAIEASGEVYGSPDEESAATVERLVRERAVRA